jgi:hypothetical protein
MRARPLESAFLPRSLLQLRILYLQKALLRFGESLEEHPNGPKTTQTAHTCDTLPPSGGPTSGMVSAGFSCHIYYHSETAIQSRININKNNVKMNKRRNETMQNT